LRLFRKEKPLLAGRALWGIGIRLAMLILLTLVMPKLVWLDRGKKIEQLTREYAANHHRVEPPQVGACTMVFLRYELAEDGAESAKNSPARKASLERTLADAQAELASIAASGARLVRMGASGDQLVVSKPDQEEQDDKFMANVKQSGLAIVLVDTQH